MEKIIMKTLLEMYVTDELSEITGTDIDAAYSETDDIIATFKADASKFDKDKALDSAITSAISTGVNYGFCDGVKVGLAIANALAPKIDIAFIQKASKAVSA